MSWYRQLVARQPLGWTHGPGEGPTLRRVLGWPSLTAIGLGTMLGGIFATIGAGAHVAGPGVIVAFVLSGVVSLCVALCYAEFASMVPVAGSAYTYAYATLGELVAWIIGWDLLLEYGISLAPLASSASDYFQHMLADVGITFPAWAQTANLAPGHLQVDVTAGVLVLAITALVAIGIRESANVNAGLVLFQLVSMIVFIAAVAHAVHPANLHPLAPMGFHGIFAGTALVFFAYIGFDTVTVASEETKRPERDVPIGIILALTLGGILYVLLTVCTVGVMNYAKLSDGAAMLDALSSVTKNHTLYWIVSLGGLAGNVTSALTSLLGQVRIFYVMARDRMLPPGVAKIHHVFRTPARMTVITGGVVAVLAAIFPLTDLIKMVNIGTLAAFAIVCAGVLVLRIVNPTAQRPFKAPLLPLFSILGAVACFSLVGGLQLATWVRYGVWFLIGIAIYALYGFRKSRLKVSLPEP
ncbi:MAG: amino acid permease [Candidatus Eremiobacteraeota bacterium]|nr:amino acid permease [Candidatus Eremiobacteraeota bacterium]